MPRKPSGLLALACLLSLATSCRGGPKATDAYLEYRKAFDKARSSEDFLTYLSQDSRAKVQATPKDEQAWAFHAFKTLNEFFDVKAVKETAAGDQVTIDATGTSSLGKDSLGTIVMVREGDAWKLKSENWLEDKKSAQGTGRSCADLAADLKGPGPAARARAAAVLGQKSCPEAIAALAGTLKDASPGIVANAAAALRSNLNPETVAAAKPVFPMIAAAKAEAGRTDDTILEINLQGALAAFGVDAIGPLVADLEHPVRDLRFGAAVGLGTMGASAKEALPSIDAALKDEKDGLVLERLAEAAKSIRGK